MRESVKEFAEEMERLANMNQAAATKPIIPDLKQDLEDQIYLFRRMFNAGRLDAAQLCITRAAMYCMMMSDQVEQLKIQQGR